MTIKTPVKNEGPSTWVDAEGYLIGNAKIERALNAYYSQANVEEAAIEAAKKVSRGVNPSLYWKDDAYVIESALRSHAASQTRELREALDRAERDLGKCERALEKAEKALGVFGNKVFIGEELIMHGNGHIIYKVTHQSGRMAQITLGDLEKAAETLTEIRKALGR